MFSPNTHPVRQVSSPPLFYRFSKGGGQGERATCSTTHLVSGKSRKLICLVPSSVPTESCGRRGGDCCSRGEHLPSTVLEPSPASVG